MATPSERKTLSSTVFFQVMTTAASSPSAACGARKGSARSRAPRHTIRLRMEETSESANQGEQGSQRATEEPNPSTPFPGREGGVGMSPLPEAERVGGGVVSGRSKARQ